MRRHLYLFAFCAASLCLNACGDDSSDDNNKDEQTEGCNPSTFTPSCKTDMIKNVCNSNGTLGTSTCQNGCDHKTGDCKPVDALNCATGTNQKPFCDGNISHSCERQQEKSVDCGAFGCNADTGLCNCETGAFDCILGNLWKCENNTWSMAEACGNKTCDANQGLCVDGCTQDTYKCDNNSLKKCDNNTWTLVQNCGNQQCDETQKMCKPVDSATCIEDTYTCDGDLLSYCYEGELLELIECGDLDCRADLGGCYDTSETCKSGYTSCDAEFEEVVWLCTEGHWLYAPENECFTGEVCVEGSDGATCAPACTEKCTYDGLAKIVCSDEGVATEVPCALGCQNAQCIDDTCDEASFPKTCRTPNEKLVCSGGKATAVACNDDEMCVDGECLSANKHDTCTWSGSACSADKRYTQNCIDGTASGEKCQDGFVCNVVSNTAACVPAFSGDAIVNDAACTDDFIPFCNADNQTVKCVNNKISITNCGKKLCDVSYDDPISVTCRAYTGAEKLSIGDKCNTSDTNNQTTFCYNDDIPVQCNSKGYLDPVDEDFAQGCKKLGMICAVSDADGVPGVKVAGCYDPCTVEDAKTHVCGSYGDTVYAMTYTCLDLGDGQLGLDSGYDYKVCDIACAQGECVDYTEEIPNVGESCDKSEQKNYCLNPSMLVECRDVEDASGNTSSIIAGEKCYTYEKCTTFDEVAKCRTTCRAGDADRTVCGQFLNNDVVITQKCSADESGDYVYVDDLLNFKTCRTTCTNGVCDD